MKLEEIGSRLEALGLGEDEATIYVALVRHGTAKASQIAEATGFSRQKVYRHLDDLENQGIVEGTMSTPTVYKAVSPAKAVELRMSELEQERERVSLLETEVLPLLIELQRDEPDDESSSWTLLEGRVNLYQRLRAMAAQAQESISVASAHGVTGTRLPVVDEAWASAIGRARAGVSCRFLLDPDQVATRHVEQWLSEPGVQTRVLSMERKLHFIVVDGEQAVAWLSMDPSTRMHADKDVGLWTDAPAFVGMLAMMHERLWNDGKPVNFEQGD